jgi:Fic family protein
VQASDFTAKAPGKLVPTERGAVAFAPQPAPQALDLDAGALPALITAERELGKLTGLLRGMGTDLNVHLLSRPFLRREAIASSRIEGTVTTPEQLVLLEVEGGDAAASGPASETREVLNYMEALEHGFVRLKDLPVCVRFIKELHAILMRGVRGDEERPGEIRTVQNFIGSTRDIREARFVPPPPSALDGCLSDLERSIHPEADSTLPPLVRLALIHYQFETIHPFHDGNGRVGRLLIPLILCAYERLDEPSLYLSPYFERKRSEYADLMLRVSMTGDFLAWVRFFLEAIGESAQAASARAQALVSLRRDYRTRLSSARSSALLLKLVDALFSLPAMTIRDAAKLLDVTPAAASANLRKLVDARILEEVTGRRREQRYLARELIAVAHSDG